MKFAEKLKRLTVGVNKAKVAREAGLPTNAVNDYIGRGYIPRLDKALKLARALNVSLEFLADDSADFPPPGPGTSIAPMAADLTGFQSTTPVQTLFQPSENVHATAVAIAFNMAAGVDLPAREKAALIGELSALIMSRVSVSSPATSTNAAAVAPLPSPIDLTLERIRLRGGSDRRFTCLALPEPLLREFCERLTVGGPVKNAWNWLAAEAGKQGKTIPSKTSIYRFVGVFLDEHRASTAPSTSKTSRRRTSAKTS
ncbi:MAG TPA: helix-turn-helix transcriptional regulator [Phycisphaerae bacterium]|nr:helix-turn-helix transcriptional regulator [Phycisphaerae bacterium]